MSYSIAPLTHFSQHWNKTLFFSLVLITSIGTHIYEWGRKHLELDYWNSRTKGSLGIHAWTRFMEFPCMTITPICNSHPCYTSQRVQVSLKFPMKFFFTLKKTIFQTLWTMHCTWLTLVLNGNKCIYIYNFLPWKFYFPSSMNHTLYLVNTCIK